MSEGIIIALIGLAGTISTFFGSMFGILGGHKIHELRLKNLEQKQNEQENHIADTDTKVVNLQIAVTAVEQKVESHDTAIDEIKDEQKKLASYHMKKE